MFSSSVIFFIPSITLAIIYVYLIYYFFSGWKDMPELIIPQDFVPDKKVSVIIAARNEENNILDCLESILDNDYPQNLLEVILINDHSEDQTATLAGGIDDKRLVILNQSENKTGKKQALDLGVRKSKGELILTTDADCVVDKQWIRSVSFAYANEKLNIATAPVVFKESNSVVENYQVLDMCGMMAVTANGIFNQKYYLANGANLSFLKSSFLEVDGYTGNENLASGDDMFLIQKMAKENLKIGFIKNRSASVNTLAEKTFSELLLQRKRWATKSKAYDDSGLKGLLVLIFLFQFSILANILLSFVLDGTLLFIALFQLFIKGIMDYLFLHSMSSYFDKEESIKSFFPASIISIFIVLYSGIVSLIPGTYKWKGRRVR